MSQEKQKTVEVPNLTKSEKIDIDLTDISKKIRQTLRSHFPDCKFSVRTKRGGHGSIKIYLLEAPFDPFLEPEKIPDITEKRYERDNIDVKERQKQVIENGYNQLSRTSLTKEYNRDKWNNGVFLTEKAHELLKFAVKLAKAYNYDDSNIQFDYFDFNFTLSVNIGKYDTPFKQVDGNFEIKDIPKIEIEEKDTQKEENKEENQQKEPEKEEKTDKEKLQEKLNNIENGDVLILDSFNQKFIALQPIYGAASMRTAGYKIYNTQDKETYRIKMFNTGKHGTFLEFCHENNHKPIKNADNITKVYDFEVIDKDKQKLKEIFREKYGFYEG